jgi:hypothetical protein
MSVTFSGGVTISGGGWTLTPASSGPTVIGQAYGGGYYAGQISTTGNGVATHYLIIAPKATGQTTGQAWGPYGQSVSTSSIDGPTNTTNMVAVGSGPATFCKNLTIGGYNDWYMPAKDELAVIYYYLKPTAASNDTAGYGSTPYAVAPMPRNTNWTSSVPGQTSVAIFQSGGSEFLATNTEHWSSTQVSAYAEIALSATTGALFALSGYNTDRITRAIRRIPV